MPKNVLNNTDLRIKKLIEETIVAFKLNLEGLTVLTEAATNYYSLGPILRG